MYGKIRLESILKVVIWEQIWISVLEIEKTSSCCLKLLSGMKDKGSMRKRKVVAPHWREGKEKEGNQWDIVKGYEWSMCVRRGEWVGWWGAGRGVNRARSVVGVRACDRVARRVQWARVCTAGCSGRRARRRARAGAARWTAWRASRAHAPRSLPHPITTQRNYGRSDEAN